MAWLETTMGLSIQKKNWININNHFPKVLKFTHYIYQTSDHINKKLRYNMQKYNKIEILDYKNNQNTFHSIVQINI